MEIRITAAAAVVAVAASVIVVGLVARAELAMQRQLAEQQLRIATLERGAVSEPNWPAIAASVEASVVTIEANTTLGSAWVAPAW